MTGRLVRRESVARMGLGPRAAGRYRPEIQRGRHRSHDRSDTRRSEHRRRRRPPPAAPPPPARPPATAAPPASTSWAPPAAAAAGARPTGITILAVLAAIGGVFGLLGGFGVLFVGGIVSSGAVVVLGLCALAYAGLLIAFAWGAWTLQAVGLAARRRRRHLRHRRRDPAGRPRRVVDLQPDHQHRDRRRDPVLPQPALHQGPLRPRLAQRTHVGGGVRSADLAAAPCPAGGSRRPSEAQNGGQGMAGQSGEG